MLEIRQGFLRFLPCSISKLSLFKMRSSFYQVIFRSDEMTKNPQYWCIADFFHNVSTQKEPRKTLTFLWWVAQRSAALIFSYSV